MSWRLVVGRAVRVFIVGILAACGSNMDGAVGPLASEASLDAIAERYVKIALAFREYDESYVDAYFGPASWAADAQARSTPLDELRTEARNLLTVLQATELSAEPEIIAARKDGLEKRLQSMLLRMEMSAGLRLPFDEESRTLFDAVAPAFDVADVREAIAQLDTIVPGEGTLGDRVNAFRDRFIIPTARLADVFEAAIGECRRRTLAQIQLPEAESFTLEYVTGQPWSGYNWYRGNSHSLIQINTDLPIYIDRAVDLGCHEGYPGHHTYNVLVEQNLVDARGWVEFALMPLYGPMSLISEGSANYGIELAFPEAERRAFERDVLFPLANLSTAEVDLYYDVLQALERLKYADVAIARGYLDGELTAAEAVARLREQSLLSAERASQRVRFDDAYRSYVINYSFGRDLVAEYLESRAGADHNQRWREFELLLSAPISPSLMRTTTVP